MKRLPVVAKSLMSLAVSECLQTIPARSAQKAESQNWLIDLA
jgi:hypothetical protein